MANLNTHQTLLTLLPIINQPPPFVVGQVLTDILIQNSIYSNVSTDIETGSIAVATLPNNEQPRPEQGGERITEDWLFSLSDREC